MTLSSGSEMHWTGRGESTAPARSALWPLKLIGIEIEGRNLLIIATWVHWVYGAAWDIVWWLLISQAELGLALTAVLYFAIVWVTAIIVLRTTNVAPWPWQWGIKYNLFDWTHHTAYVGGTTVAWVAIEKAAGGL